jgi:hypothetical protein
MRRALFVIAGLLLFALAPRVFGEMIVDVNQELRKLRELGEPRSPAKIAPGIDTDIDNAISGNAVKLHIPNARYRVAVFEFDDADGSGLGSAAAKLIAREVLLNSRLGSLGVLRYKGSLRPSAEHPQSYFDKVDLVVAAQDVDLAIWGSVRREAGALVIDVQAQLPDPAVQRYFRGALTLPKAMGGETLTASVWPTRVQLQRLTLPGRFASLLLEQADSIDAVRDKPDAAAPPVRRLPVDTAYSVAETRGEWTRFVINGESGWVRRAVQCRDECAPLLASADFVGALLKFGEGGPPPKVSGQLSRDTAVVARQLVLLTNLRSKTPRAAGELLAQWDDREATDFGAPYANLLALTTLTAELRAQRGRAYDEIRLDEAMVRAVATRLAEASQNDPRNRAVLENLAVLFRVLQDERRATLASGLAAALKSESPEAAQ